MRIDRLQLETTSNRVDLRLHPGLTFVTGLGPEERQALGTEILDSLRHGHPGLSVDVVDAEGHLIEVYRPLEGSPTVRDAVTGDDLTDRYLHFGTVDLLSTIPRPESDPDSDELELLRVQNRSLSDQGAGPSESASCDQSPDQPMIQDLASVNQDALWATAIALAETEVELAAISPSPSSHPNPDALRDLVEERHQAVEVASDLLERDRVVLLAVAATLALIALIGALLVSPFLAIPFLLAAIATGAVSAWRWRELQLASQAEVEALEAAGLTCYLKLRMSELNDLTGGPASQESQLKEIHALAIEAWTNLVGTKVSLEWAVLNRREIQSAAKSFQATGSFDSARMAANRNSFNAFIPWLDRHLKRVAQEYKQSVPVVIDHCFMCSDSSSLSGNDINMVVDLLARHSQKLQLIVMTDNPELLKRFPTSSNEASILTLGRESQPQPQPADLVDLQT